MIRANLPTINEQKIELTKAFSFWPSPDKRIGQNVYDIRYKQLYKTTVFQILHWYVPSFYLLIKKVISDLTTWFDLNSKKGALTKLNQTEKKTFLSVRARICFDQIRVWFTTWIIYPENKFNSCSDLMSWNLAPCMIGATTGLEESSTEVRSGKLYSSLPLQLGNKCC